MSNPIPHVYDHILQITQKETSGAIIRNNMVEFSEKISAEHTEHTYIFDVCRDYVTKGTLYEYINNEFMDVCENEFVILHPDIFHSVYPSPHSECFNILISKSFFENLRCEICSEYSSPILNSIIDKKHYYHIKGNENIWYNKFASALFNNFEERNATDSLQIQLYECMLR